MTSKPMQAFSKANQLFEFDIQPTESVCPEHDQPLVLFHGHEICPNCAKELLERDTQKLEEELTKKAYAQNRTWLANRSIFSDYSLKSARFDTFETTDDETVTNKEKARQLAGKYLKKEHFNVMFSGNVGTGKSHLAMSMLQAVNQHCDPTQRCLFVSIDELMRRIKDSFNNPTSRYTESAMVDLLTSADLLVIDDLGAETGAMTSERNASDFNVRVLNAIVNGRMNKSTIFTTNLSSAQMNRMYDDRIVSRIMSGVDKNKIITFKQTKDKRNRLEF